MIPKQCRNCNKCEISQEEDKKRFGSIVITRCEPIRAVMDKTQHCSFEKGECPFFEPLHVCANCRHLFKITEIIDGNEINASDCDLMKTMPSAEVLENGLCEGFEPIPKENTDKHRWRTTEGEDYGRQRRYNEIDRNHT